MPDQITPQPHTTPRDDRPGVAFIAPQQTPYRVHYALRIAREMPQIKIWSVFTHEFAANRWKIDSPAEVNYVQFGAGEFCTNQDKPQYALREWRRGGRIIQWMIDQRVRAVVMLGYNDPGRLRIIRWCRRNKVPVFMFGDSNIRGDVITGAKAVVKQKLVRWVMGHIDGCMPCGTLGEQFFIKYGADPRRIYYTPYEPNYDLIANLRQSVIEQTRVEYGWSGERRRVVFSARVTEIKRPDLIIDAFSQIAAARPQWDLVMLGTGNLLDEMKQRVPQALRDRVTFTGFIDDQQKVSAIYRNCDLLVLPSDYEPWALVINEAAAAGLAIIATDVVGAAAELVRDGVNGFTFSPGELNALVRVLLEATDESGIECLKSASAQVLADWRRRGDPVEGLRRALVETGVIAAG